MLKKTVNTTTKKKSETTKKKSNAGRPSKKNAFNSRTLNRLTDVYKEGYTDKELAELLGLSEQTIHNYKKLFPAFFESIKTGKAIANKKVEAGLYQRAIGYSFPSVHILSNGKKISIIKHVPPDPQAAKFWLTNRDKESWQEKIDHEVKGAVNIKINYSKGESESGKLESKSMSEIDSDSEVYSGKGEGSGIKRDLELEAGAKPESGIKERGESKSENNSESEPKVKINMRIGESRDEESSIKFNSDSDAEDND